MTGDGWWACLPSLASSCQVRQRFLELGSSLRHAAVVLLGAATRAAIECHHVLSGHSQAEHCMLLDDCRHHTQAETAPHV